MRDWTDEDRQAAITAISEHEAATGLAFACAAYAIVAELDGKELCAELVAELESTRRVVFDWMRGALPDENVSGEGACDEGRDVGDGSVRAERAV